MREHENEPIPGLPEQLPAGERILWQGAPEWRALARRTFHVWKVTLYCAIIVIWNAFAAVRDGATVGEATIHTLWISPLPLAAIAILLVLAYFYARSTMYTVTNRRLVVRSGVAFSITVNLPFRVVESAGLRTYGDDTGDVAFVLGPEHRVAYLQLWPNVRPWHFNRPQPMLRGIAGPEGVAKIVADALAAFVDDDHGSRTVRVRATPERPATNAAGDPATASGR